nr:hypothetical protein [Desulfobulbaceae bacterium]
YLNDDFNVIAKGNAEVVKGKRVFVVYQIEDGKNVVLRIVNEVDGVPGIAW